MQGIDLQKIKEVKSFAANFRSMGIVSMTLGTAKICTDSQKAMEMLLNCFDPEKNNSEYFAIMDSEKTKRNLFSGKYETDVVFCGGGPSEYEFTVPHLFQLSYGEIGLDYELLKETDFSIRFDFIDVARATDQIYDVACMELSHKKGEDPTEPQFKRGNIIPYIYNMDNIVSVLFSAKSMLMTYASIGDRAGIFLDEIKTCSCRISREEVIKALKKNEEALKRIFNVSKFSDIYNLKCESCDDSESLKAILEEASK